MRKPAVPAKNRLSSIFSISVPAAVIFAPLAFGTVEPWSRAIFQSLILVSLASGFSIYPPAAINKSSKFLLASGLVLLLISLVQFFSIAPWNFPATPWPRTVHIENGVEQAGMLTAWCAWIWVSASYFSSSARIRFFCGLIACLGGFIALVGILQMANGNDALYGIRPVKYGHPFGPFYNSDNAATFLSMALLTGAGLFLARLKDRPMGDDGGKFIASQVFLLFAVCLMLTAVLLTQSRGARYAMAVTILFTGYAASLLSNSKKIRFATQGLTLSLLVFFLWYVRNDPRMLGFSGDNIDASTMLRVSMYESGARMIADFAAWGIGHDATRYALPAYQDSVINGWIHHMHSDWLSLPLEFGLPAAFLAVLIVGKGIVSGLMIVPTLSIRHAAIVGGAAAAVLYFCLHSMIDFPAKIPANAMLLLALLNIIAGANSWTMRREPLPPAPAQWRTWLSGVLAVMLIPPIAAPAVAAYWENRARNSPLHERSYLYERSLFWSEHPEVHRRLAAHYLELAEGTGEGVVPLLRRGLRHSTAALSSEPLNPRYMKTQAAVLSGLGRHADADELLTLSLRIPHGR